jgi:hypothetical protein
LSKYRPEQDWPRLVPRDKITVSIHQRNIGQTYGVLGDISDLGATIVTEIRLEPSTVVLLRIAFRNVPDGFVTQGEIVWTREASGSSKAFTHGVIFSLSEEEHRAQLREILDSDDFKLAHPGDSASASSGGLDKMLVDLTEDLDKLGSKVHGEIGRRG